MTLSRETIEEERSRAATALRDRADDPDVRCVAHAPPEYTRGFTGSSGCFELSDDGTGVFLTPSGDPASSRHGDVATGALRAARHGDQRG